MTAKLHFNANDLTGMRVGNLVVIGCAGKTNDQHIAWLCQCDCGNQKVIASNSLLRKRASKSCGCNNKVTAVTKKKPQTWNDSMSYSIKNGTHCYKTRHSWAKAAIRQYGNKCQLCGWDKARCDVHHKTMKSIGGPHTLENAIVLCPNCHRIEHECGRGD